MALTWRQFHLYLDSFTWVLQEQTDDGRLKNQIWDLQLTRNDPRMKSWKQQEIERLEARQTVYPAYVERALAAIRAQCPKADARVLCDHIEVTDVRWQSAIEGYIGGARFGIIVDADYEADAIRIVRAMPGRDNRARVIQGAKALRDASRLNPQPASILQVLKFTHGVAQAYIAAHLGMNVDNAAEAKFLKDFAAALGLEPQLVAHLDQAAAEAKAAREA